MRLMFMYQPYAVGVFLGKPKVAVGEGEGPAPGEPVGEGFAPGVPGDGEALGEAVGEA